jgi:guanylate kinase
VIGVILYGPPAAGKDTVTSALSDLDPRFTLFRRLKAGGGRTSGYRVTNAEHLADLRVRNEIVWENARYGSLYAVDRPGLLQALKNGVPVVHLGQVAAVTAVKSALMHARWLAVSLSCSRQTAIQRIRERGTGDDEARIRAWDETELLSSADVTLDTDRLNPQESASLIAAEVGSRLSTA